MTQKISQEEQDAINKFHDLMVKKMKKGKSKEQIVEELVADGYTKREAQAKVNEGWKFVMDLVEGERFSSKAILPAIFGGIIGAAVGGGIWGLVVVFTSLESTWMATGVGVVVGFWMMLFTKSKRGFPIIMIALLFSLVGILFGRFIFYYHFFKQEIISKLGETAASKITFFSKEVLDNFGEKIDTSLDGASGVWIFFALVAAWKMTSSLGIKVKEKNK